MLQDVLRDAEDFELVFPNPTDADTNTNFHLAVCFGSTVSLFFSSLDKGAPLDW